jgi:hypothetical protein
VSKVGKTYWWPNIFTISHFYSRAASDLRLAARA